MEVFLNIFNASQYGHGLVNVVTGKINNDLSVNVDGRVWLGKDQMENFQKSPWWIL